MRELIKRPHFDKTMPDIYKKEPLFCETAFWAALRFNAIQKAMRKFTQQAESERVRALYIAKYQPKQ